MRYLHILFLLLCFSVAAFAQSADQEVVSAVDSPDPVTPGSTLSYTVTVRNNGPNAATNGGININLPLSVTRQNEVVPAGWSCSWMGNNGTCSTPSFAANTAEVLTINVVVNADLSTFPDQSINATFFPSGTTSDPNNANNSKMVTTQVDTQQVDLSLSATDSPDPVFPDGNVTYNVPVTNGGSDTASNVNFNVIPNSSLRFVSATVPAGWNCTLPSVGAMNATFTCNRPSFAPGTDTFVVVFSANDEQFGINDTSFQTSFSVGAGASNETDNSDNSVNVTTQYVTPDADMTVSVTDSPDPVSPDGNITYTVTVGNIGPDAAPNVTLNSFGSNNLRFVSASVPAGWNCNLPAAGTQTAGFSCTLPGGMVSGGSSVLTFVLQATDELIGINNTTVLFGFSVNSSIADPDSSDNSETESTAYVTPDADVEVEVTDSPDPVNSDGDITYSVKVTNNGPDTAPNATLNVPLNNTLRFQSISVPAGWNCSNLPAVGAGTSFSCTNPSFASGGEAIFSIVLRANDEQFGSNDQTITQNFNVTSSIADPDNTNNSKNVSTSYVHVATGGWTTTGNSGATEDESNPAKPTYTNFTAAANPGSPAGTYTLRYNINAVGNLTVAGAANTRLRVRFRDEGAGSRVTVAIIRSPITGGATSIGTVFDSDTYLPGTGFQTQQILMPALVFDFSQNTYWLEVTLTKAGTANQPGLGSVQINQQ